MSVIRRSFAALLPRDSSERETLVPNSYTALEREVNHAVYGDTTAPDGALDFDTYCQYLGVNARSALRSARAPS